MYFTASVFPSFIHIWIVSLHLFANETYTERYKSYYFKQKTSKSHRLNQ